MPGGGFYFWLELLDTVDWDRARELAAARGIECRPGDTFVGDDRGRRFLRLSPIQVPDADIEPGIVALAGALPRRDAVVPPQPWASRSQVVSVTPLSRSSFLRTRPVVSLRGKSSSTCT